MGQAKQRQIAEKQERARCAQIDLARVAAAVRRVCAAGSPHLGSDCLAQSRMARAVLERLGVPAQLTIGYAAWRVGPGRDDVLSHYPGDLAWDPARAAYFHAWLVIGDHIFDVTTSTIRLKAKQLDALDGARTTVTWCPDYLWMPLYASRRFDEVAAGRQGGVSSYRRQKDLEASVLQRCPVVDDHGEGLAWLAYQAPAAAVLGPNNFAIAEL